MTGDLIIPDAAVLACVRTASTTQPATLEEIPGDIVRATRERLAAALPFLLRANGLSGPTPYDVRRDALYAAADLIGGVAGPAAVAVAPTATVDTADLFLNWLNG